jgi:hypothetical protein
MDADDARYERPCRWFLAAGAVINWTAAALMIYERLPPGETVSRTIAALLQRIHGLI